MNKRILFYSSVSSKELFFTQRFYYIDITLIKNLGYEVHETNRILDFLCFWKYHIAFIYFYKFGLFPAILARLFHKKVYFTGGIDALEKSTTNPRDYLLQKYLFKLCHLFSTNCILVSKSDADNVRKIYNGMLPERTSLSFHTIDVENFTNIGLSEKESIFTTIVWMGSVGNVCRKGVDEALKVYKCLSASKAEYAETKFYIIGKEGNGTDYLKKLCDELQLHEKVIFTGSIDEEHKINILKRSKYYFQLSTFEGFGIAALEALAAKNIVIHSGRGGLNQTIKDYGIKINIEDNIEEQANYIYERIPKFDSQKLIEAENYVKNNYSNIKRQKDFEIILNDNR